jgi:hypothetical protein
MNWYELLCGACGAITTFIVLSAFVILSELRKYLVI